MFEGVTEEQGVTPVAQIDHILSTKMRLQKCDYQLVDCHRVSRGLHRPKAIYCRFATMIQKGKDLKAAKFLKGSSVHIHEDYSSEVADERNTLYPIYKKALSSRPKINVKLSGSVLQIAGKRYTYSNFTDIPDNLLPVTTRHSEEIHVFYGQWNPLSSMYPCVFEMDGLIFRSSEHYFQFKKGLACGKNELAAEILSSRHPMQCHRLAKRLNFDCSANKDLIAAWMLEATWAKFTQNPNLCEHLLETGELVIGEASKDTFFGTGLALSEDGTTDSDKWSGDNLSGKILTDVRDELK